MPLRSRMRPAVTSAFRTAKYGVQATATWNSEASAPIPAITRPPDSATLKPFPSRAGRNLQPMTAP